MVQLERVGFLLLDPPALLPCGTVRLFLLLLLAAELLLALALPLQFRPGLVLRILGRRLPGLKLELPFPGLPREGGRGREREREGGRERRGS